MINNAGLMPRSLLERARLDDWDRMIDVNLKGVLYGVAAALPHMKVRKSGPSSTCRRWRVIRYVQAAVYAATKTAVRVISEGLRQEVKPYNIRTTIVSPGAVATELPDSVTEANVAKGIYGFRDSRGIVRTRRGVRDEPARRRRRERGLVPANQPGTVSRATRQNRD